MRIGALLILTLLLAVPLPAMAGEPFELLTASGLSRMIAEREAGLLVIDSRSPEEYRDGHIGGAINIPLATLEQDPALPQAPANAPLVFYCSGST